LAQVQARELQGTAYAVLYCIEAAFVAICHLEATAFAELLLLLSTLT
jgi:hypothetical protein